MEMMAEYDVVIMGGALSGSATAILLLREHPEMKVLIVEKATHFDRKVGEATTEVSGEFFHRRLAMAHHLMHEHIVKQSLRMWWAKDSNTPFDETVEIGAKFQSRFPSYQIDRSIFDEHLLKTAADQGADILRPAEVVSVNLERGNSADIAIRTGDTSRTIKCRWLVDASGRKAYLAKKLGMFSRLGEHPTAALWARLRGAKDWDGFEMRSKHKRFGSTALVSRECATNHLGGFGWWCWMIPLRGGDFSVGIVFDTRYCSLPAGDTPGDRLMAHLMSHPVTREIFADAVPIEGDVRARGHLPYHSSAISGTNWQIVGDAAGFIDPLYSPGMDYCSWTSRVAFKRISEEYKGNSVDIIKINEKFVRSYRTWFEALYKEKYTYIGDAELMSAAYLLDIGLFFLGPGRDAILYDGGDDLDCLPFNGPVDRVVGKIMRFYNKRFAAIARKRRAAGCYGRRNTGWQELYTEISPAPSVIKVLAKAGARWLGAELHAMKLNPRDEPQKLPQPSTSAVQS